VLGGTGNALAALGLTAGTTARNGGIAGNGVVIANDVTTFTNESISGGAVTAYNAAGTPVNLQLRWAKVDSATLGSTHQDTWELFYQTSTSRPAMRRRGRMRARCSPSAPTVHWRLPAARPSTFPM